MRVVINQKHLRLNESLAVQANHLARNFNNKNYSRIENVDKLLLKQDISVEKKKQLLLKKLHDLVLETFSIDGKKFNGKTFEPFKKRLHNIRRVIIKLRSINYYLETAFLEELKLSNFKIRDKNPKLQQNLARDEIGVLEYTAYKLIGKVITLDKRLLKEYSHKEEKIAKKEKTELNSIELVLKKETGLMEHIEAKTPPSNATSKDLLKEPVFSHWVARVFALLTYLEHLSSIEKDIFKQLKKNKSIKAKINRKIIHIVKEKSKLLRIMEEKAMSMKKFNIDNKFKKEFHNLIAVIRI